MPCATREGQATLEPVLAWRDCLQLKQMKVRNESTSVIITIRGLHKNLFGGVTNTEPGAIATGSLLRLTKQGVDLFAFHEPDG